MGTMLVSIDKVIRDGGALFQVPARVEEIVLPDWYTLEERLSLLLEEHLYWGAQVDDLVREAPVPVRMPGVMQADQIEAWRAIRDQAAMRRADWKLRVAEAAVRAEGAWQQMRRSLPDRIWIGVRAFGGAYWVIKDPTSESLGHNVRRADAGLAESGFSQVGR